MLVKALVIFALLVAARDHKVRAFSTDKPRRHHLTFSDEALVAQEEFVTRTAAVNNGTHRREILEKGLGILSASALGIIMGNAPAPVWADVSDGNALPQGAAQFGRVVRAKTDLLVSWTDLRLL